MTLTEGAATVSTTLLMGGGGFTGFGGGVAVSTYATLTAMTRDAGSENFEMPEITQN
jgi:hypothetical protein